MRDARPKQSARANFRFMRRPPLLSLLATAATANMHVLPPRNGCGKYSRRTQRIIPVAENEESRRRMLGRGADAFLLHTDVPHRVPSATIRGEYALALRDLSDTRWRPRNRSRAL